MNTTTRPAGKAEAALKTHNFPADKLLAYAHTIARKQPGTLGDKHDDLIMYLTEQALKAATTYDTKKTRTNYTFASYIYDIMEKRVPDFYRMKSEGFGDRRKGHDNRIHLTDTIDTTDSEWDFNTTQLSLERKARWQRQATLDNTRNGTSWTLEEWILISLDHLARNA